jgi:predicted negative regulator of RcsB-dependent stress response
MKLKLLFISFLFLSSAYAQNTDNKSMGDFYAGKKDKQKAIEYYSKALSIKPWPETKKKLDDLNNGK